MASLRVGREQSLTSRIPCHMVKGRRAPHPILWEQNAPHIVYKFEDRDEAHRHHHCTSPSSINHHNQLGTRLCVDSSAYGPRQHAPKQSCHQLMTSTAISSYKSSDLWGLSWPLQLGDTVFNTIIAFALARYFFHNARFLWHDAHEAGCGRHAAPFLSSWSEPEVLIRHLSKRACVPM